MFTFSFKRFLIGLAIVIFDLFVYFCLGIAAMAYDDFYEGPPEAYWSWGSMTTFDKGVYVALMFWHMVNLVGIAYIIVRFVAGIIRYKKSKQV